MKIVKCLIKSENTPVWGVLEGENVSVLEGTPFSGIVPAGRLVPLADCTLLAPEAATKIVAVGKNYRDHALEMGGDMPKSPIIFLKPTTSIARPGDDIPLYRHITDRVDFEGELAFVVKKTAKNVNAADFSDYILGYTCCNDVTARTIQKEDGQWTRGKGFDGFCPLGPVIETELDPKNAAICTKVNGKTVQQSNTKYLQWDIPFLLAFITASMTLLPGDVVTTGTPAGIGPLREGDCVEVFAEGVGTLVNTAK